MNKNIKQMKASKAKQEEEALNRILLWLAGGALLEFLLLLLNRYYNAYTVEMISISYALRTVVKVVAVVTSVCAGVLAVQWNTRRKREQNRFWSGAGAAFLFGLSMSCFATWLVGPNGLRFAYVTVPVVIVLMVVYYLYQREFFFQSICSALALLGIWIISNGQGSTMLPLAYTYAACSGLLIALGVFLCRKAQENGGKVEFQRRTVHLFSQDTNYPLLYAGAGMSAAVLVSALFTVAPAILYGVAVAWVLVMAVYYTVKII